MADPIIPLHEPVLDCDLNSSDHYFQPNDRNEPSEALSRKQTLCYFFTDHLFTSNLVFGRFTPQFCWPIIIVIGQFIPVGFGWIFFIVTKNNPMALPNGMAEYAQSFPQIITMAVTLTATLLSIISGFFYSRAIRFSLTKYMAKDVSLFTIASSVTLAQMSPIFNLSRWKWTVTALFCSIAIGAQTAAWTTLLTPKRITLSAPMEGFELDLTSEDFLGVLTNQSSNPKISPDLLVSVENLIEASGNTAVSSYFKIPSIFSFNQLSYINSTSGILPANYVPIGTATRFSVGAVIPANTMLRKNISPPAGFSSSYVMSQQGFTADVSCQRRTLDKTTSPSLEIVSATETILNRTITLAGLKVLCPHATDYYTSDLLVTSSTVDAILSVGCYQISDDGTTTYDIIMVGSGSYNYTGISVCRVTPQVTTLTVLYNDTSNYFNSSRPSFVKSSAPITSAYAFTIGWYTTEMFLRAMQFAQGPTANSAGDVISTYYFSVPSSDYPDLLNNILQEYIKGVLEFSATLIRTVFTQSDNRLYPGNHSTIPESMRARTNGTFQYQSFGWHQDSHAIIFLAPTVVAFLSIMIIVVMLIQSVGCTPPPGNVYFDPGDILHVIGAASGTQLRDTYPAFSGDIVEYSESVRVSLGQVEGGKIGFIVS